jgi:hypothetical protein
MEEVRRPCVHRGTEHVLTSPMATPQGTIDFNICRECRRFWLERDGWLLSRREAVVILRHWPMTEAVQSLAR